MMKKTKKNTLSTDYFFEALFNRVKAFLTTNMPSKLTMAKLLAFVNWVKDIN